MTESLRQPPALHLDHVQVAFGDAVVVREFNLSVVEGDFVSLVGPSGCGKSTILRCVAGLEVPTAGSVTVGTAGPLANAAWLQRDLHQRIGFVFQKPNLLPWRSVLDNIALPLELAGMAEAERIAAAGEAAKLVGLSATDERKLPKMLSGGMRMRVSLARAIVTRPTLMLMDEPLAALDDLLRLRLNEEILGLWSQQKWTTLFVTHHVSEAVFLSRRVAVMSPTPGTIVETVDVPLPYPRKEAHRRTEAFLQATDSIDQALRASQPTS